MALPRLKEPDAEPEDLSKLHNMELIKILYEETKSARAQAVYQELSSREALEDLRLSMKASRWAEDQRKGPQQTKTNAQKMRDDWLIKSVRLLLIAYATRHQLIAGLHEDSKGRYRGKNGAHIEKSTLERWLTTTRDEAIRIEVDRLRINGITAATYNEEAQKQTLSRVV